MTIYFIRMQLKLLIIATSKPVKYKKDKSHVK